MGTFTDRLFRAIEEWSRKTEAPDDEIRRYIMGCIGRFDEEEDTERNLDLIKDRLEMLIREVHLSEGFLIKALIQDILDNFEYQLEDARKGENSSAVIHVRESKRKRMELASEQERQSPNFQRAMKLMDIVEQKVFPTPEKIAQRKLFLDVWREVTAPILQLMSSDEAQEEE
jgi:hypothetical protein